MSKRLISLFICVMMSGLVLAGCTNNSITDKTETGNKTEVTTSDTTKVLEKVKIQHVAENPEYETQEREIWEVYMEKNPNVEVEVISANENQETALQVRVASGDAPDMASRIPFATGINKTNYKSYVNLLEIDYPYWDLITYDIKGLFEQESGIKGYVPTIPITPITYPYSFIYYEDDIKAAGLDPRSTVRSMEDLDKFLADLKTYVDKSPDIEYVLDWGWNTWCISKCAVNMFAIAQGENYSDLEKLWKGDISWTDVENNPYASVFKKWKEYYDKGYLPRKFFGRTWDDFEAGFIAKKSVLTFHGPWIWTKVSGANPNANLNGFPLPGGMDGAVASYPPEARVGGCIFADAQKRKDFDEVVKAFSWYFGPEAVKMKAQVYGATAAMDLSSVGGLDLESEQYNKVLKPLEEGEFGNLKLSYNLWGEDLVKLNKVDGKPEVLADDSFIKPFGDYLEDKITLEKFLEELQKRWESAYKF